MSLSKQSVDSVQMPRWKNNSCYIDSLIYTLHCVAPALVNRIRRSADRSIAKKIRQAFKEIDIQSLRKLFKKVDPNTDWLHAQQEPIEVIFLLNKFFVLPKTVYTHETIQGSNSKNSNNYKLIRDKIHKTNFASIVVDADNDKKLSLTTSSVDKVEGWDQGFQYRIVKKHVIIDQFAMIHINRNNFGQKKKAMIKPPKILQKNTKLRAVLVHLGDSPNSGHYVSYILKGKIWYLYDDMEMELQMIGKVLPESALKNCSDFIYA